MPGGNPNWVKGMAKVPGSGRKRGVKNKIPGEIKRAQAIATLKLSERTPQVVEKVHEMIMDPETNLWARIKLIELFLRHSLPIPQVKVETEQVTMDSAGDLAVTVVKQAEQHVKTLQPKEDSEVVEGKVISPEN